MQEAAGNKNWLQKAGGFLLQQIRDDWPAVIFIACLFSILDNYVGWLRAAESYAFIAIGNVAALVRGHEAGQAPSGPRALVILIGPQTWEIRYHDRSPLNRCQLRDDLVDVYEAMQRYNNNVSTTRKLDVLVVDLDLRPWRWLAEEGGVSVEAQCEGELHHYIRTSRDRWKIDTVLVEPFEVGDQSRSASERWMKEEMKGVRFGRADLPVNYGLAIKQRCDPRTLAAVAFQVWAQRWPEFCRPTTHCISEAGVGMPAPPRERDPVVIDPRQYRSGVVPLALTEEPRSAERSKLLDDALKSDIGAACNATDGWQAVFFGAGYSSDDLFVTPLGDLYGVEVHAAGFLSFISPVEENLHWYALLADIVFGFAFGLVISWFWGSYYRKCLSNDAWQRLHAPFILLRLSAIVVVMTTVLLFLSYLLLRKHGVWASPVSMAVGMLVDSFVFGPAQQGVSIASALQGTSRPERRSFAEGARKLFGGAIVHFWRRGDYATAEMLVFRLIVWVGVVATAIVLIARK